MALRLLTLLYVFAGTTNLSPAERVGASLVPAAVADHVQTSPTPTDCIETNTHPEAGSLPIRRPEDELVLGPDDRDPLEMMVDAEEASTEDDGETAAFCPEGPPVPGKGDLSLRTSNHLALSPLLPAWRTPLRC
ncbi:hypothetical protein [Aquisphaera insulae]|uniref:hypothetical protein n=1 Tax=Aquisphaera insulae TaxID=2712864 RepID=UPI0013E9A6AB|nr:hypothetical protein [Aquisphaera insulae]